jgi:cell division septation protein DedD
MVAVEKYIRKLLFEQDCVIIPELGGLLTHHINAQFNSSTGIFMPAQKRVAFNEVLKLDDGLLTYFISVNEKITREEALASVKSYTENLRTALANGGKAVIDGVGEFVTNPEGKLVFEPVSTQNFNVEWFGFQSIKVDTLTQQQVLANKPEVEKVPEVPQLFATEEVFASEETGQGAATRRLRWGWGGWAAAAVVVGMAAYLSVFTIPGTSPAELAANKATRSVLSTLNPVYGISDFVESTLAGFSAGKPKEVPITVPTVSTFPTPELGSEVSQEVPDEVLTTAAPTTPESILEGKFEPAAAVEPAVENTVKKFYIIAGSFEKARYATILVDQLRQQGFSSAFIMEPKGKGLIKVSAIGYDSVREAYSGVAEVERVAGEGAWVYKN